MEIPVIFFLSAVSREFHHPDPVAPQRFVSYRAHLAESLRAIRQPHDIISRADIIARDNVIRRADPDAQPGQIAVASQENLAQGFGDLLESLEDEVRNATVVVHLVGDMAGVAPKAASRRRLAERHPDFLGSEPELRDRLGNRADITYTQWELYFAYHHGCRRLVFTADSDAPRSPAFVHDKKQIALQHAHRARIEVVDKHTSAFTDQKDLVRQTIDNLIRRGLIADPGVSEPDPKAIDAARALLESIVPEIFAFSKKSDRAKVPLLDLAGVAAWIAALDTVAANHGLNRRHLCALLDEHLALLLEKADASADPAPYLDLAFTYFALARYPAAIATARRAIVLAEALPSDDERGIVTRRKHLLNGWNLIHSAAAQNHDHQLAAQALQNGGANIDKTKDPVLWADYHEPLVEHYIAHAQWQPAEDLLSEIVDIREELPGESSRALANTLNLWATLLYHTAKYPGTASVAGRAAQLFADALPPDTTGLAAALNNQASALQSLDRHSEAEPLMRRALAINEASYGKDHPEVATHLNNLAALLQATNRLGKAEPLMRRALGRGRGKNLTLDERHQCSLGAVLDDLGEDLATPLEQAGDGRFSGGSASALAADAACAKGTLVHFHFASKGSRLLARQLQDPQAQPVVEALRTFHAEPGPPTCGQRRHVRTKQLQDSPKLDLGNVRVSRAAVFH